MSVNKVDLDQVENLVAAVRSAQSSLDTGVQLLLQAPSSAPVSSSRVNRSLIALGGSFGNTSGGAACQLAYSEVKPTMDAVLKTFAATADSDAERLELALATYRKTDAESADTLLEINRNKLDVISTHLTKADKEHGPDQAAQINRLRGLAGDPLEGSTVVAGDFNAVATGDSPSAQGIREFGGQGFDVGAGDIHDGKGGTSENHHPIDHVLPRGVGSSEARRWDRGESDHDGQVVDVTLPSW